MSVLDETWTYIPNGPDGRAHVAVVGDIDEADVIATNECAGRLAAAAPELYRALAALHVYADGAPIELQDECKAALAKARGEVKP